jgi:hypothetical protein
MADGTKHREAAVRRILDGEGKSSREARRAAFDNENVVHAARELLHKVAHHAYKITDEDVAMLKQTLSEDEIFELVVCAAVGHAMRQLEAASAMVARVTKEKES